MKDIRIDPLVLEVAKWFIQDDFCSKNPDLRDDCIKDLAETIQCAIDDWFFMNSDIDNTADPESDAP